VSCLLGEKRSILPSSSGALGNPSVESPVMVRCEDGGPPRVEPMGERLRPPKWSVLYSRLPKRMVSPREKPPHDKRAPPASTVSTDDGTIRTSRGKAHCKSPFLVHQLLVVFALARYRVVKITHSYSEVVLRSTKHTIFYTGSSPSLEVISLRPVV
jgi:hypothetical protein